MVYCLKNLNFGMVHLSLVGARKTVLIIDYYIVKEQKYIIKYKFKNIEIQT